MRPRVGARIRADHLQEISGIVASRKSPGLFWLHNDSGDSARVYALTSDGRAAGSIEIPRKAFDFEDIALERRQGAPDRIYVADTGDNLAVRKNGVFVHRFDEPTRGALLEVAPGSLQVDRVETMRLHFPDGPQNAEALLVDSHSGEIILITRPHMAPPEIYGVSEFTEEATLRHLGTITLQTSGHDFQIVTAADISADGRWLLLRSYSDILAFPRPAGESILQALLGKGCRIQPAFENQGEAIAFVTPERPQGLGRKAEKEPIPDFVTIGEGAAQALHFYSSRGEGTATEQRPSP